MNDFKFNEGEIYLVSNHAVARNPMFSELSLQKFFIEKVKKYLEPISEIVSYNLHSHEFQLLLKTKDREDFEQYFIDKKRRKKIKVKKEDIPESTNIFSQAMANLQVSFVKKLNYKYGRTGSLMARRFSRKLIETEEEMVYYINHMNMGLHIHTYAREWVNDLMNTQAKYTSSGFYNSSSWREDLVPKSVFSGCKINLGASLKNLLKIKNSHPIQREKLEESSRSRPKRE